MVIEQLEANSLHRRSESVFPGRVAQATRRQTEFATDDPGDEQEGGRLGRKPLRVVRTTEASCMIELPGTVKHSFE